MKKALLTLMCLTTMIAASTSVKAQEVTVTLIPGWTWISCPTTDTLDFATALGGFTPMQGDIIKSQWGHATYMGNGQWRGTVSQFYPGYGYHYMSNRAVPTLLTMGEPLPQLSVTTAEPTDITIMSAVVGSTVTIGEGNHVFARGVCWGTEELPTIDGNHTSNVLDTGSFTDTLTELTPSTTYYVRAYMVTDYGLAYGEELSFTTLDDYVDLGLPSGLLWATCNVGAETPEDYGDYFAWGETTTKSTYNWSTYQYCNGSSSTLTKYCSNSSYGYNGFTDNLTNLLPEDDAAAANWGGDWRMPTKEEWQELLNNTTSVWTTQNGVNGRLFTAANGNSLFLPAAGVRRERNLEDAGSTGNYRSSSLVIDNPYYAWSFNFNSGGCDMFDNNRSYGRSVRAVRSTSQNVPAGAINGLFSVSASQQVYFSQGNLQYQASTNTWKFADNQYDYVGNDNGNIASTYDGWIDLFGWGTSGYNHGAVSYQPWSTSQNNSDYYAYGSYTYNLYNKTGKADWGYNPISNGGNIINTWRTLTQSEWNYVFSTRVTPSGIRYAKAQVDGVNGVILLPDDWSTDTYSLSDTNNGVASFSSNVISATQWAELESVGVVFLPAAGNRNETSVVNVGSFGLYWSASYDNSNNAINVFFRDSNLDPGSGYSRRNGRSVRLVRSAE